jgi:phage recombination protein Bet
MISSAYPKGKGDGMATETNLAEINTPLGLVQTSIQEVRDLLFGNKDVVPTDLEIGLFLKVCSAYGLNPFLKDAHLVKYKAGQPAAIITGKDSFTKKARAEGASWLAGIVVLRGQQVIKDEGSLLLPGDQLVGGWAAVLTAKGQTFRETVALKEYASYQSTWKSMPATMIRKVALVHTLREAYPDLFGGMYDASEMAQAYPNNDLVQEIGAGEADMPKIELPSDFSEPVDVGESAPATNPTDDDAPVYGEAPHDAAAEIECPLHEMAMLSPQTGKFGPYWSHKEGSGWCNLPATFKANTGGKAKPFVIAWNQQITKLLVQAKATPETRQILKTKIAAATGPEPWAEVVGMLLEIATMAAAEANVPDTEEETVTG